MAQRVKKRFHWAIMAFAVADVLMGIMSIFVNHIVAQTVALIVTALTLYTTIIYAMVFHKEEKISIGTIVVGTMDFIVTAVSIMVIALSVQILELLASGATLFKTIKLIIQSDKAQRLIKATKPIAKKAIAKIAPFMAAYIAHKTKNIKKQKGEFSMKKVKEFFVKLAKLVRANKVSLLTTLANGGTWGVLGWLVNSVQEIAIDVGGFNITPLFAILGFFLLEPGLQWEKYEEFINRIEPKKKEKEEQKRKKAEEKAQKQQEAEKEKLISEMRAQMNAEKEAKRKKEEEEELAAWIAQKEKIKEDTEKKDEQ